MKITLICIASLLSVGCIPRGKPTPPPTGAIVTPVEKKESAQGSMANASKFATEADRAATIARARLDDARTDADKYKARLDYLAGVVAQLKASGNVTMDDLLKMEKELIAQEAHINSLIAKLSAASSDFEVERDLRSKVEDLLREARGLIVSKENEADNLRQQLSDAHITNKGLSNNARDNFEAAMDSKTAAAEMEGQRNLIQRILIWTGVALIISILINVLQARSRFPF